MVTVELPHLHTVTVAIYVKVGSRFESREDNGLSHFVEHMLYRGTERHPTSYELNFAFESLGSSLCAETGRDYSLYQVAIEASQLAASLELFGELFIKPRFSDIELERRLILEEINEDYDEKGVELNSADIARGLVFGDHPLGQRIIGSRENVERFSREDVCRHFEEYYCAHNIIVAVAGPVRHEEVAALAAVHLEGIRPGEGAVAASPTFAQRKPQFEYVPDRGAQSSIEVVWRAMSEQEASYVPCIALLRALDDGMSTRLHYRLCDQLGLAYNLNAALEPMHDVTLLEVVGSTANAKVPELARRLFALMDEFRREPVSTAELEKIKRRYRYDLACTIDDPGAMVGWFGGTALYYDPTSLDERAQLMDAVTADDLMAAANEVLRPREDDHRRRRRAQPGAAGRGAGGRRRGHRHLKRGAGQARRPQSTRVASSARAERSPFTKLMWPAIG